MLKLPLFILVVLALALCSGPEETDRKFPSQKTVNKSMEKINREIALDERAQIDGYIDRQHLEMESSGTGLRYRIYEHGNGRQAVTGMTATVNYTVSLLDGTELYSSKEEGSRKFLIGQDNIESGIHEGVCLMREGDKAIFILPSHLAHGLSGDNDKIPPRSSVVYNFELVGLQ